MTNRTADIPAGRTHWVYRAIDTNGVVLYVGRTKHPLKRLAEHKVGSHTWPEHVARWRVSGPYTYPVSRQIERSEQIALRPVFGQTPYRRHGNFRGDDPVYTP